MLLMKTNSDGNVNRMNNSRLLILSVNCRMRRKIRKKGQIRKGRSSSPIIDLIRATTSNSDTMDT